jgi:hypothetical protein
MLVHFGPIRFVERPEGFAFSLGELHGLSHGGLAVGLERAAGDLDLFVKYVRTNFCGSAGILSNLRISAPFSAISAGTSSRRKNTTPVEPLALSSSTRIENAPAD